MEFSIKPADPQKLKSACVVVGVFENRRLTEAAERLDQASRQAISRLLEQGDMTGKSGTSLLVHALPGVAAERVLLIGLGKEKEFREAQYRTALRTAMTALSKTGAADATLFLPRIPVKKRRLAWRIRQAAIIAESCRYRFDRFKSAKDDTPAALTSLLLAIDEKDDRRAAEAALAEGLAIAEGMRLARDLGNLPGNLCTPSHLAQTAQELAVAHAIDCQVLEYDDMEALGMHALLSVAKGSRQPPKFIVLRYCNGAKNDKPTVLIGKGVTFDSGGISLKPGEGMDEMKFDMCGAAAVLGTLKAAAVMKLPINLVALIPATENLPGGAASKPGDIVVSMSGQSIEILNTDAEGRLILCDALAYAERFKPRRVIDVATLTGACVVALGHVTSGLFANDEALAEALRRAGDEALDRAWPLPLWDDYQELLKSNFADMANIGGRWGGAISAACFLSRFAKKFAWAHLDVAGTAWVSGADKGATGRPVPLLVHYLLDAAGRPN